MTHVIVDRPVQRLAALRYVGPYDGLGAAFDRLGQWAGQNMGAVLGAPMAIYLDDPRTTPSESLRTDLAFPVTEDAQIPGVPGVGVPGVGESHLAGGRYAMATHVGPYADLGPAWELFMTELAEAGAELDGQRPCFEVYQSDPRVTPEAEYVTLLHQPLR